MYKTWHKSSYSASTNPNCVECRDDQGRILIRDTQHRHLGHLDIPAGEWAAFLSWIRSPS